MHEHFAGDFWRLFKVRLEAFLRGFPNRFDFGISLEELETWLRENASPERFEESLRMDATFSHWAKLLVEDPNISLEKMKLQAEEPQTEFSDQVWRLLVKAKIPLLDTSETAKLNTSETPELNTSETPKSFKTLADRLRLFSIVLSRKTRKRVFEPFFNEMMADFLETRRYRTKLARSWLTFCFTFRTLLMVGDCLRVAFTSRLAQFFLGLLPEAIARFWGRGDNTPGET